MKKYMLLLAASLTLGLGTSCSSMKSDARTNYTAPSTSKIGMRISNAQDQAVKTSTAITAAAAKAKTAKARIKVIQKAVESQPPILTLALELEGDIDDLTAFLLDATSSNNALQEQLREAQVEKDNLQQQVNEQTILLNTANAERNRAITAGARDKQLAHRLKWFIIGLAMAATGLLIFVFFRGLALVPPLLYITLGAPAAVGVFLFFWIGSG